jgi:hypothetical protein
MTKYTFSKVAGDDDARDVLANGVLIGRIHYTWTRLGGWGWNHGIAGKTHRSMKDAARELARKAP